MPFCGITYLLTRLSKIQFTHKLCEWPLIEAHGGNHGTTHKSPPTRFLELFHMSLADFIWLADKLRIELAQDPVGCSQPLSVEAQVGVGLYIPACSWYNLCHHCPCLLHQQGDCRQSFRQICQCSHQSIPVSGG
ncbi:hypothetical protein VP01_11293g2 [Puccinia sorghi]|uniref:Uncharacterized protein n=1 Tax=Puccinia sorghi TaxID=27349 RepID=A0A0L6VSG1_9BASI|nr:hypothetical protein VP01_11293g2 [Puccinia sorghi]